MRVVFSALTIAIAIAFTPTLQAQAPAKVDKDAVKFLREQGLDHSQVMDHLSWMCDVYGPRLTGSPNLRRAQKWALDTFSRWGLKNAHLESWGPFGLGWRLDHFSMHVTGENPWPVHAWPKAWSPGVKGRVEAEVVYLGKSSREEIEAMDLSGKIVLMEPPRKIEEPFDGDAVRFTPKDLLDMANSSPSVGGRRGARRGNRRGNPRAGNASPRNARMREFMRRRQLLSMIYAKQPLAVCDRSYKGDYGTIFVSSASVPASPDTPRGQRPSARNPRGAKVIPQFTLGVEHYNRMVRMLAKKVPVKLALELKTTFFDDDLMQYNVLAEIPGTDPAIGNQVVMLGGHYDSWHSGTGATDNGAGSAVMMEAIRLVNEMIKQTGKKPRRTIRIALWSGEEQGLLGSRAYVSKHFAKSAGRGRPPSEIKPEHAGLSAYYNVDNGTGRIRGVYLQGNEAVAPIFRAWLKPFHDLDAATLTLRNTGGTDHLAFDGVGLPGFQFIQDRVAYDSRTHHSNMDLWDHAVEGDLKQAATIVASFVWHTAQRDDMLPRKPMTLPPARSSGGGR